MTDDAGAVVALLLLVPSDVDGEQESHLYSLDGSALGGGRVPADALTTPTTSSTTTAPDGPERPPGSALRGPPSRSRSWLGGSVAGAGDCAGVLSEAVLGKLADVGGISSAHRRAPLRYPSPAGWRHSPSEASLRRDRPPAGIAPGSSSSARARRPKGVELVTGGERRESGRQVDARLERISRRNRPKQLCGPRRRDPCIHRHPASPVVAVLDRPPALAACHAGGRGFESRRSRPMDTGIAPLQRGRIPVLIEQLLLNRGASGRINAGMTSGLVAGGQARGVVGLAEQVQRRRIAERDRVGELLACLAGAGLAALASENSTREDAAQPLVIRDLSAWPSCSLDLDGRWSRLACLHGFAGSRTAVGSGARRRRSSDERTAVQEIARLV